MSATQTERRAKPEYIWQYLRRQGLLFDGEDLRKPSRGANLQLWHRD